MKNKIITIGMHDITNSVVTRFKEIHPQIEIIQVTENLKNPFEREPITIHNFRDEYLGNWKYVEVEPSKFIGKPKNNFKR